MESEAWEAYFVANQRRAAAFVDSGSPPPEPELLRLIVHSLRGFHLGEAGEGRVAHEAELSDDPTLDGPTRRAIGLYVREEGRHAREVGALLAALGSGPARRHWSESLFRRGRRLLGLRTKMMTIGSAEVVGIAFYGMLRDHGPTADVRRLGEVIGRDEEQHLAFQADWFGKILASASPRRRPVLAVALGAELVLILGSAITAFTIDHGRLVRALGVRRRDAIARCLRIAAGALPRVATGEGAAPAATA